jgi:hypothetical protein
MSLSPCARCHSRPDYPDIDFQLGSVETAASNIGQNIYVLNAASHATVADAWGNTANKI